MSAYEDDDSEEVVRDRIIAERDKRHLVRTFDSLVEANLRLVESVNKLVLSVNKLVLTTYGLLFLNALLVLALILLTAVRHA